MRTISEDLSSSYFERALQVDETSKNNAIFRCGKVASLIKEFINACKTDITSACFKMPVLLALMGYGDYIISSFVCIAQNDDIPIIKQTITLLSNMIIISFIFLKNTKAIKRFFLYNMREYDYPHLLSLVYPLRLEKPLFDKVTFLADSLQCIEHPMSLTFQSA